ncbi:MAG: DUF2309 family protein [Rubrobacter sp.]|nr:DUF2309 family protein [Rubrobacter sp.]
MSPTITNEMRHHLKHEVDHVSHLLAGQGPITTFIHHNTLHGLQHLPFEQAISEARRLIGGAGYFPNERYRELYKADRIADEDITAAFESRPFPEEAPVAVSGGSSIEAKDIRRIHLLHGIEALDPARLRFEAFENDATTRLREGVPEETRARLMEKAASELEASLDRVGREWTLSEWMEVHLGLDLTGRVRAEVRAAMEEGGGKSGNSDSGLRSLAITADRRDRYLACIDRSFGGAFVDDAERDRMRRLWLASETRLVKTLARRHFGVRGTLTDIARHFEGNIEGYAVLTLWNACLDVHGLEDPLSPTDSEHFTERDVDGAAERMEERFRHMERWGGPPIPLTEELKKSVEAVVQTELELLQRGEDESDDEASTLESAHLCWLVLHDLGKTGLNRRGFAALEILLSLRENAHPGLLDELRRRDPRRRMHEEVRRVMEREMNPLGRDKTHSEFLEELTGEALGKRVNDYMVKRCAAFLDEGLAAWRMPGRSLGFYDAWKSLADKDRSLEFDDLPGWREKLNHLPALARDAVIGHLDDLGVKEEDWGAYIGRTLMELPGWAGMIQWRETHPHYPRQETQPIDLIQFLAARFFYETLLIQKTCRETWRIDGSAQSLRAYFETHPSEFFVRRELHKGNLPDHLAEQARILAADKNASGGPEDERWQTMADMLWTHREADGAAAVCGDAWRLFHLAQFLGLSGGELRRMRDGGRDALIAALDAFPAADHGPVWLAAYERNYREKVLNAIAENRGRGNWRTREGGRPRSQSVYCIDEREEAIRRHLEEIDPGHETFGAAGFFGIAMHYLGVDDHDTTPLCPPVIHPVHKVEERRREEEAERMETHKSRSKWEEAFHNAYWETERNSVSAYFLIHLIGFIQSVPLVGKILAPHRYNRLSEKVHSRVVPPVRTTIAIDAGPTPARDGAFQLGFTTVEQADRIETMLRNIGLTHGFARIVLFAGHGSSSHNNPHESAYDCGACGGKHGAPNARAFAAMSNSPAVRAILRERGIAIPDDTWFVGSEHHTGSELITYLDTEDIPESHKEDWRLFLADMDEARSRSAQERCRRFASAPKDAPLDVSLRHVEGRVVDMSQARPELGHATNASAIVGRRSISQGVFLDRRAFLISYDASQDPDGSIVERILLAVGPVGAGISLEYYFSTVDNVKYGSDTKVPHNVSGLIGVMEGAASDLRTGLPRQMVEVHEPMRLLLIVEASLSVLGEIYGRQPAIQELVGNAWVQLAAMDPDTGDLNLFVPDVGFVPWDGPTTPLPEVENSFEWYRGETDFLPPARIVPNGVSNGRGT